MAKAPLTFLIDKGIKNAAADYWYKYFVSGNVYGNDNIMAPQWNVGPGWITFPSFHSKVIGMEEMEWKGNYIVEVESQLLTSLKAEGLIDYSYDESVVNHIDVAQGIEGMFSEIETEDLEETIGTWHGVEYTNQIEKVYEIRMLDTYADMDESDMLLEHKWTLQLMLFQGYA